MAQKERSEIEEKYKWNLTDLYESVDDWKKAKTETENQIAQIQSYKGTLGKSADNLLKYLTFESELSKKLGRLALYSSLLADQDVADAKNQELEKEMENLFVNLSQASSFVSSEMAAIEDKTYEKFLAQEPKLQDYSMVIDRTIRQKAHTLSEAEEALLSKTSILGNPARSAYNVFSNAEIPSPKITLKDGTEMELDHSNFQIVRASAVREDREAAFCSYWENYKKFEGTFGEMMNGDIRKKMFSAQVRKYNSALEKALDANNIPTEVYRNLIANVNKNLPTFHRYLRLKQRLLGVDQLKYSDLYAPAVADIDLKYSYEEAQNFVLEAIAPLGDDYVSVVKRAFDERWIDVMPNKGKRTGAYSNGAAYDVHPYILMNYDGSYDNVGTLIHELGHTMQSYYSNKNQPFPKADYTIFVAEVASTFNEALLDHIMLQKLTDKKQRISLLMSMLDGFKGTLFRQTQFAEFQLEMIESAERGEPITGKRLSELYGQITRKFYGHDLGVCEVDDRVFIEWAFIPHFYMGFYVYQYSTSFVASQALSEHVLSGDKDALEKYMNFLSCGDSKYPIDELKDAGVDMLSDEPFNSAIAKMNALMDEIEKLLE